MEQLLNVVADAGDKRLPEVARPCLMALGTQLRALKAQLLELDRLITAWHRSNETSKRLDAIPGHYGQRSCEPRKQAEHVAAPTNAAYVQESPCQLGAVHTWG